MDSTNVNVSYSVNAGNLKILTWNINGIRSFAKRTLKEKLDSLDADIICLQETKVTRDMIDEETALVDGYTAFFSFSRKRSGYSGVATYCRDTCVPARAEEGLTGLWSSNGETDVIGNYKGVSQSDFSKQELKDLDYEGRAVITQHEIMTNNELHPKELLTVINLYCPRVDPDKPERLEYKLNFCRILEHRINDLRANSKLIVLGDMNISHKTIDHCDPSPEIEFNNNLCRQWLSNLVDCSGVVDLFRHFHPTATNSFTCWNTFSNARATNYGTRIDYIFAVDTALDLITDCTILSESLGSDHCPVKATLKVKPVSSDRCPSLASKYFPEFSGKQLKLDTMFKRHNKIADSNFVTKPTLKRGLDSAVDVSKVKSKQMSMIDFVKCKKSESVESFKSPVCISSEVENADISQPKQSAVANSASGLWKALLTGPKPAPMCPGHNEPCVMKTVTKKGPNLKRTFWSCARGAGKADDPSARCSFFQWVSTKK